MQGAAQMISAKEKEIINILNLSPVKKSVLVFCDLSN